jgi:hypothetical protein
MVEQRPVKIEPDRTQHRQRSHHAYRTENQPSSISRTRQVMDARLSTAASYRGRPSRVEALMSRPELATDRVVVVRGGGDRLDTDHLVQIEVAGPDRRALAKTHSEPSAR